MTPTEQRPGNRLLRALAADDYASLAPHLSNVELEINDVLANAGQAFKQIYFPSTAVISIVNFMSDGSGVEVGTVGDEGFAGLPAYLEAEASEGKTFAQIRVSSTRMPVQALISAAAERPALRHLLNRYTQAYMTQVAQSAACNRLHSIEQRCARWLLMTHDRMGGSDTIPLKHEFLALMLGVRRAGVTVAAGLLQDVGLIRYRRGTIRVVDRTGLEKASCECYAIVRRHFDRLLPQS